MENTIALNYSDLALKDNGLIKEINQVLGFGNPERAGLAVSRVLHTIRKSLSYQESAEFIKRLPEYLKVMFVMNWKPKEERIQLRHLDEFTEEVLNEDDNSEHKVFFKEVDALTAVITVLKTLNRHVDLLNFPSFHYNLKRELQETMLEVSSAA
ncbi:DUF2267 domain-containing protein [Fulvivirga sediminis]|uniref:DUF2267 domain-containing protein n=1 Tax=Fulvivirga sediminis TaxID=2803949 RepID=A0A937F5M1_9BACT|nr:DUF2267 domain-containing protein [Fulvivirga sediminis]MBL3654694.1 DUF2267 domain-containing protein [Fulvivirga sediminis]